MRFNLFAVLPLLLAALAIPARGDDSKTTAFPADFNDEVYLVLQTASLPADDRLVDAEHPLLPVLSYAHEAYERLRENVQDYQCVLTKREQVDGRLRTHEMMEIKLRHRQLDESGQPDPQFSIYIKYLTPEAIRGREVLYTEGENDGDMWVTKGGQGALNNVTLSVDPKGERAMRENRYPATEVGMLNLTARLIEEGSRYAIADDKMECQVRDLHGARINGRTCRYIEVKFPVKREGFRFHVAQIFIDEELEVPVRFVSYDWPAKEGEKPPVMEEYTYTEIELNEGLTDADFDRENVAYNFYVPEEDKTAEGKPATSVASEEK